jgi:hypothetical protein
MSVPKQPDTLKTIKKLSDKSVSQFTKTNAALKKMHQILSEYKDLMDRVEYTNIKCEETLGWVLLAIRQHQCMQAWVPAQNGQDEQIVVGSYKKDYGKSKKIPPIDS